MAAESGSEPKDQQVQQQDCQTPPLGWNPIIEGRGFYQLQPTHPAYPPEWAQQLAADCKVLKDDQRVADIVASLKVFWTDAQQRMAAIRTDQGFADWYAKWSPIFQEIRDTIEAAAELLNQPSVSPSTRRAYLAEQVDPQVRNWFPPGAPVEIIVNADNEPLYALDPLAPGEMMVRFSGVHTRDLPHALRLITDGRSHFLAHTVRRRKSGAPTLDRHPKKSRDARAAALMTRQGRSTPYIAKKLNLLRPGETGAEQRVSRQVNRLIAAGELVLAREEGKDPAATSAKNSLTASL